MAGTTILDKNIVAEILRNAFFEHGFDKVSPEEIKKHIGYAIPEAIREILTTQTEGRQAISDGGLEKIDGTFTKNMKQHYLSGPEVFPVEDALEVFEDLQQLGIKIGLNTAFNREITDVLLERMGWKTHPLIDITVSGDEISRGRPYPDMILQMMAALGIGSPAEIIKIGDTAADILEGKQSGCLMSIGVTSGLYSRKELSALHPTHIFDTLSEIVPMLEGELTKIAE